MTLPSPDQNDNELYDIEMIQKAMLAQNADALHRPENYIAPSTPTEEKIAQIWKELLSLEHISVDADLFKLGGDSIIVLQILARIQQVFQVELSMAAMFNTSFTISQLSDLVNEQVIMQADQNELDAILEQLDGLSDDEVKALLTKSGTKK